MDQLFHEPIGTAITAALFVLGAALLARAEVIWLRSRRKPERRPMLLPIRAWRHLILAIAVLIGGVGFATGQAWVVVFALVLGFTEGLESSMMVSALAGEEWDTFTGPPEIAGGAIPGGTSRMSSGRAGAPPGGRHDRGRG